MIYRIVWKETGEDATSWMWLEKKNAEEWLLLHMNPELHKIEEIDFAGRMRALVRGEMYDSNS